MRIYTVYERRGPAGATADRDIELVKEGFSWPGFWFAGLWALYHGLWLALAAYAAVIAVVVAAIDGLGLSPALLVLAIVAAMLVLGMLGNDIRRWSLRRRGAV